MTLEKEIIDFFTYLNNLKITAHYSAIKNVVNNVKPT